MQRLRRHPGFISLSFHSLPPGAGCQEAGRGINKGQAVADRGRRGDGVAMGQTRGYPFQTEAELKGAATRCTGGDKHLWLLRTTRAQQQSSD